MLSPWHAGNALERNIMLSASHARKCQKAPTIAAIVSIINRLQKFILITRAIERPSFSTCLLAECASCCFDLLVSATRKIIFINPCLPCSAHLRVRSLATTIINSSRTPASQVFSDHSTRVLLHSRSREEDCLVLPLLPSRSREEDCLALPRPLSHSSRGGFSVR